MIDLTNNNEKDIVNNKHMHILPSEFGCVEDLESVVDPAGRHYIYEFDVPLPNGEIVGKVGYTTAPKRREREWREIYKDWFNVHFSYLGTSDIDKNTFFMDHAAHEYGKQHENWRQVTRDEFPHGEHYTKEAYHGATKQNTARTIKTIRETAQNGKTPAKLYTRKHNNHNNNNNDTNTPTEPLTPRENQHECINNILAAYVAGRHHLLCAAHPRYGKTFTALYALDKIGTINFVMVVSAIADAHDEWARAINLPNFRATWDFIDSNTLANGTRHEIEERIATGKKVCLFTTLQDIEGGTIKEKHEEIYKYAPANSFLIIDETHNGARGIEFSKKIKQASTTKQAKMSKHANAVSCDHENDYDNDVSAFSTSAEEHGAAFGFADQLHLSGTPYRILMSNEFAPEDIVYLSSYSDLMNQKHDWYREHPDEPEENNPYHEFPERYNLTYDLKQLKNNELATLATETGSPDMNKILETDNTGKFVHEELVKQIIHALTGALESQGCWGVFADKTIRAAVNKYHVLIKLPSIAACDALAVLLESGFGGAFAGYAVIRATSNVVRCPSSREVRDRVARADASGAVRGSITLTCERFSAAVSVPQWNIAVNATNGKSAQDYEQFALRTCTPYTQKYATVNENANGASGKANNDSAFTQVIKPNAFVIDFVPERVLSVTVQAATAACVARGVTSREAYRVLLADAIAGAPCFIVSGAGAGGLREVTATNLMDLAAGYASAESIDTATMRIPLCDDLFSGSTAQLMNHISTAISTNKTLTTRATTPTEENDNNDNTQNHLNNKSVSWGNNKNTGTDGGLEPAARALSSVSNGDSSGDLAAMLRERAVRLARQRAFFARVGYYAVLANRQYDSLESLLEACGGSAREMEKLVNVTGLSIAECWLVAETIARDARARVPVDDLVYNMSRRINDKNLTREEKLKIFTRSFAKLGESEIITPHELAVTMVNNLAKAQVMAAIRNGARFVELASETGEFAVAMVERFTELGFALEDYRDLVCAVPASSLAFECSRKVFELLGLDPDNVYNFTAYELLDRVLPDKKTLDSAELERVSGILKQDKKPGMVTLDDVVMKGTDKVEITAIVGNPPYQVNTRDDSGRDQRYPIYNLFIDFSSFVTDLSILITPARFLSDVGKTSHKWNISKLNDAHFSIIKYYSNSSDVFPDVDIKGGVVITRYDKNETYEPIGTFVPFQELKNVLNKVTKRRSDSFSNIAYASESYKFTDKMHDDHPEIESMLSRGHKYDLKSNVISKLTGIVFFIDKPNDSHEYVGIIGRDSGTRVWRYIRRDYLRTPDNFHNYKVLVPAANGSGAIGEVLSTPLIGKPLIGKPLIGYTQTFMSFGNFKTEAEAQACLKYIKTKFARAMLGIMKVTQTNPISTWRYVPLQDFTDSSDIDWSQSVENIDKQLYDKYGLSKSEIRFIEKNIQAMS